MKQVPHQLKPTRREELSKVLHSRTDEIVVNVSWTSQRDLPIGYSLPTTRSTDKRKQKEAAVVKWTLIERILNSVEKHRKAIAIASTVLAGAFLMGNRSEPLTTQHLEVLHLDAFEAPILRPSFSVAKSNEPKTFHELSFVGQSKERKWVHPIAGIRIMPDKRTRIFGAHREGERPAECGLGHCGVDLVGEIGTPIRATLGGTVLRANHNPEANGGRYIKLAHGDSIISYYMHLDTLAKGLKYGSEVAPGQIIGTLGDSDIETSPPHLHFSVATIDARGGRLYVDPLPMLENANFY